MNPRFRFTVGSEPHYQDLVGDLYFDDEIVCVLTQESGFDAMDVQLHGPPGGGPWRFPLADFEAALEALKRRLGELRRTNVSDDGQDPTVRRNTFTNAMRRADVLLSVQRALLGKITPSMRAVTAAYDDTSVKLTFYFDGPISDADEESASCAETEVMADMADPSSVSTTCKRIDRPAKIEDPGPWVFARNED